MQKFRQQKEMIFGLQQELHEASDPHYAHRLHCVLLAMQGTSARKVAEIFGDSPRTVQSWVSRFENLGLAGLVDEPKQGAPSRLKPNQILELDQVLRSDPRQFGLEANLWDGKILSAFIQQRFKVQLSVRQCQRMFHQFGFRLRKPRPEILAADLDAQKAYKKTQNSPRKQKFRSLVFR